MHQFAMGVRNNIKASGKSGLNNKLCQLKAHSLIQRKLSLKLKVQLWLYKNKRKNKP